jgi:predicted TIM-barrel fold metal-dependent hydrolase
MAAAQDEASLVSPADTTATATYETTYPNNIAGEFTPSKGFSIFDANGASLNISAYGLFRYVNQTPGEQTFTDHLGRVRSVKARNDLNWHRTFIWLSGHLYQPQFRYTISVWSLPTTQQTLVFGVAAYTFSKGLTFGAGMGPNVTTRSMQGSWPFWAASDRQMAEEFHRAGFSSAFFARGEPIARLSYTASINTNLSQLGVTASNDTRDFAYSGGLCWMPTTGEFGPRGGLADLEEHKQLATRFGVSACHAREGRGAPLGSPNNETQLRLSDGVYVFEEGALADGVTIETAVYESCDAGCKNFLPERVLRGGCRTSIPTANPGLHHRPRLHGGPPTWSLRASQRVRHRWVRTRRLAEGRGLLGRDVAVRESQLAVEPASHPHREVSDRVDIRLLHRGPERNHHLARDGLPVVMRLRTAGSGRDRPMTDVLCRRHRALRVAWVALVSLGLAAGSAPAQTSGTGKTRAAPTAYEMNDVHFHLTNYIQEGTDIHDFLKIMGTRVGRVALFGIPLQQMWSYENTGDYAPTYYLQTDAPLYYYSFTDAAIAMAYKSLTKEEQARFDPMITGFNPADMYAADHIRRVLKTFPGVFSGIGEFTIHKEFVSGKIAGGPASLLDPALDRIFDFAGEVGLVVLLHNDVDVPFPKPGQDPYQIEQLHALFKRHPKTTIIWAHVGLGRIVRPVKDQLAMMERALAAPELAHVSLDISWDEVAKYIVATPQTVQATADVINRYPDRFLFGTDEVAPTDQAKYLKIYDMYAPLFSKLTPEARQKLLKGNYERLSTRPGATSAPGSREPEVGTGRRRPEALGRSPGHAHREGAFMMKSGAGGAVLACGMLAGLLMRSARRERPPRGLARTSTALPCSTWATRPSRTTRPGST